MLHGFDTEDRDYAVGALCVYAVYRSRDHKRFRVSTDMWDRIERYVKSAAKRARDLPAFIERLKPRLCCGSLRPKYCASGLAPAQATMVNDHGELMVVGQPDRRDFMVRVLEEADDRAVLRRLLDHTFMVIALVRDRLEREKPIEAKEGDDE